MKNLVLSFILILLSIFILGSCISQDTSSGEQVEPAELIYNGDASAGTENWGYHAEKSASASAVMTGESGRIQYKIESLGKDAWHVQGFYGGLPMIQGNTYLLKVDMSSTVPRNIQIRLQKDSAPYTGYFQMTVSLTRKMKTFQGKFTMKEPTDDVAKLCFNLGYYDSRMKSHVVEVDNLSILSLSGVVFVMKEIIPIRVDQIGYVADSAKKAMVVHSGGSFSVKDVHTKETVFQGDLSLPIKDRASRDTLCIADFSSLTTPGEYYIEVEGLEQSHNFVIREQPYKDLQQALQKMLYYQRCGEALPKKFAGTWAHSPCHTADAKIWNENKYLSAIGGWHDAGDYGRYIVPLAKTLADLMLAGEFYEESTRSDDLGIPESGNGKPDIEDQIAFGLNWSLKMQDLESGGVYHKLTTEIFQRDAMPDVLDDPLFVSPISATATADFAAVTAMASRLYREKDDIWTSQLLEAAEKAWVWLEANPDTPGFKNPEGIITGEYGSNESDDRTLGGAQSGDERFWAATELFLATDKPEYHDYLTKSFQENPWEGLGWGVVGDYALISYVFSENPNVDPALQNQYKDVLLKRIELISQNSLKDGYGISLETKYPWGSNMTVSNNGVMLLIGYELTGERLYYEQALDHLHYLLGRNALGQSYITGFGSKFPVKTHHRPSTATGKTVPGMVVGGPNMGLNDPIAKIRLQGQPPAKCYIDEISSYSTNEITIYWNTPVFWLVSGIMN
ncbi:MAG: glycoside hydrolase family 9 protein [Spirochaetales bacterium]|nr:glycoside hydrolase family 9 protein [Spirochaetales bacterium]